MCVANCSSSWEFLGPSTEPVLKPFTWGSRKQQAASETQRVGSKLDQHFLLKGKLPTFVGHLVVSARLCFQHLQMPTTLMLRTAA